MLAAFDLIFASSDVIAVIIDGDGTVVRVNQAAERAAGMSSATIIDDNLVGVAIRSQDERRTLVRSILAGNTGDFLSQQRRADGEVRTLEVHPSVLPSCDGDLVLTVAYDVTEREARAAELAASRRHFRMVAENSSDFVMEATPGGQIQWVSPSVSGLLGWAPEELVGLGVHHLIHPDDLPVAARDLSVREPRAATTGRLRMRHKDGTHRWMAYMARPLRDVTGEVESVVSGWRDATEAVAAEAALRESRERFRLLAENSSDVVMQSAVDGRITWVSPSVTRVLGWLPEELVGRNFAEIVHAEDLAATAVLRESLFADSCFASPPGGFVVRVARKGGEHLWMSSIGIPVFDDDGNPVGAVGGLREVDALVQARTEAVEGQRRLAATLDSLIDPHALVVTTTGAEGQVLDFRYAQINQAAAAFLGRTPEQVAGTPFLADLDQSELEGFRDWYHAAANGAPLVLNDFQLPGTEQRLDVRGVRVGDLLSFTWRDVTDRYLAARALAESELRYRMLAEHSSDIVYRTDPQGILEYVSPAVREVIGWAPEELVGTSFLAHVHPEDLAILAATFPELVGSRATADDQSQTVIGVTPEPGQLTELLETRRTEIRHLTAWGEYIWLSSTARVVLDEHGRVGGLIGASRDINQAHRDREELQFLASHDPLTKLPNRTELMRRLDAILAHEPRQGLRAAVLFCDVDDLKAINDTFGHDAGDEAIVGIGTRIREQLREQDIVARIGGDEFVVVLASAGTMREAELVAGKIHDAARAPLTYEGRPIDLSVSIGIAMAELGESPEDVLRRADHAVYEAKRSGRNRTHGSLVTAPGGSSGD